MPLELGRLRVKELPRREYLLEAEAASGGKTLASAHAPLMRPYAWEACGPLEHLGLDSRGPLDGDTDAAPEGAPKWSPLKESHMDHFGVLDFGLFTSGNSLFPVQMKTIYARTRVKVPETGKYLIKVQSDDQMLLWLDGREILRWDGREPVTRTAVRLRGELSAGEHRIRMRVNQFEGRWQACLRIRTEADGLSRVTGIEPAGPPRE
jgi:hypothetical protein